jgi:hypothetical protein
MCEERIEREAFWGRNTARLPEGFFIFKAELKLSACRSPSHFVRKLFLKALSLLSIAARHAGAFQFFGTSSQEI